MHVYFPQQFPKNPNKEKTVLRIKRGNLKLDTIIQPQEEQQKQIFSLEKKILEHDEPNIWNIHHAENMERGLEIEFEKFTLAVIEKSGLNIDTVTTKTFYAKVEQLKEKYKP